MTENRDYAFRTKLNMAYEEALDRAKAALKEEGFGVLTSVDVKATMKEKLGVDFRPYTILGACNPPLSHKALTRELETGLVLPCNVIVYEEGEGSAVAIADPLVIMEVLGKTSLADLAQEAKDRLQRVMASISP